MYHPHQQDKLSHIKQGTLTKQTTITQFSKRSAKDRLEEKHVKAMSALKKVKCKESKIQRVYRLKKLKDLRWFTVFGLSTAGIVLFLLFLTSIFFYAFTDDYGTVAGTICKAISVALVAILGLAFFWLYYTRSYRHLMGICICAINILCLVDTIEGSQLPVIIRSTEAIFCVLLVNTLTQC
jgi:hypothetical protein